jgi:hypothetical protein
MVLDVGEEKEGTGWALKDGEPKQIQFVTGFALEDGYPYAREKDTFKSVSGRVHSTKEELRQTVEKEFKERIEQRQSEVKKLQRELKAILANFED